MNKVERRDRRHAFDMRRIEMERKRHAMVLQLQWLGAVLCLGMALAAIVIAAASGLR